MFQNYIFDLYGTLVDIQTDEESTRFWEKAARYFSLMGASYAAEQLKTGYVETVFRIITELSEQKKIPRDQVEIDLKEVFDRLFRKKGVIFEEEQLMMTGLFFRNESITFIRLYRGSTELLQRLKCAGKKVYLLSNAQRMFTEPEMRMLGIYDLFDGILYSSDAGVKKPSTLFFDTLMEKYGLRKEESVMIGNDCDADIAGACAYGMASMYIHTNQSSPLMGPLPADTKILGEIGEVYPA